MSSQRSDHSDTPYPSIPEHCIRERAYEIYVHRSCKGDHATGDWLTAEAELRELKKKAADMVAAIDFLTADEPNS
jgi:hypothetical protein